MATFKPYQPAVSELEAHRWALLAQADRRTIGQMLIEDHLLADEFNAALAGIMDPRARQALIEVRNAVVREGEFLQAVRDGKVDLRYLDEIPVWTPEQQARLEHTMRLSGKPIPDKG